MQRKKITATKGGKHQALGNFTEGMNLLFSTVHRAEEEIHALCEITQGLVLASLGRSDFFPLHPFKVMRACEYLAALTASAKIWIFPF